MTFLMIFILIKIFDIEYNHYNDFNYYISNPYGAGPNIGFRFLLNHLNIESVNDFVSISLALILNGLIDVGWILLFRRYLNDRQLLMFVIMLALHPYLATYTLKLSSIIFAKLAVLYFFYFLVSHNSINTVTEPKKLISWILLVLMRNSNIFIFLPILVYTLRKKPIFMLSASLLVAYTTYYLSSGYLDGLNSRHWPWNYNYVSDLTGIDNSFIVYVVVVCSRIILLFGAREKLFTEGIEPFLSDYLTIFELLIYFLISVTQLSGFYIATMYFFKRFSYLSLFTFLPLLLAILTVSHARYLLPYVPLCLFGISRMFGQKKCYTISY